MTTLRVVKDEPTSLTGIVAKRIRVFLAEHMIKQVEVAQAIGMSAAAFSKRVNGQQSMDLDEIETLANALGVDPGVFLHGATPPANGPHDGGTPQGSQPSG
ncbi:helix-turn-helix domain-containing protein [Mycolicibacterium mageritense]|uniref:helix-turn-helix domain-containing protein n=1 Tax=Mycolicibacterium mageritense TaxID=53462 RepID=UPI001E41136E|nr:helix-turn-helix transcriptional regulator [Mycolicibacterium mageritense]GJJ24043.1 hypothetical protein MTY414_77170 [Mycolicibacterium mageritense]